MSEGGVAAAAPWLARVQARVVAAGARLDLKTRLSLLIGLLLGIVLALAVYAVLGNARRSVDSEIDAVMRLAERLLAMPAQGEGLPTEAVVAVLGQTRHLCVDGGPDRPLTRPCPAPVADHVPGWFVRQLTPLPRTLALAGSPPLTLRSDPADEILEAWNEARPLLLLIVAIGFLTNAIVVLSVWRALRPIDLIRDALADVGRGVRRPRLPATTTPELRTIVEGIAELGLRLDAAREDNRRLLRHSLEVQETERRSIARELHDEIGQSLAAIDAEAALLQQRCVRVEPALDGGTRSIRRSIATLYDGLHRLLARLRPAGLDEFGLGPALQNLAEDWAARCPQIRFEVRIDIDRVPGDALVQVYLYRIAQEALTNATRHSGARRISLLLYRDGRGATQLQISDDGCGFGQGEAAAPTAAAAPSRRGGLGLLGMVERAETLGAEFGIGAAPGGGTTVSLRLPAANAAV